MTPRFGFSIEAKGTTAPLFKQVHGFTVIAVSDATAARQLRAQPPDADGAWTIAPGVELSAFSADCVPLLFYGEHREDPIAAVHSGWRGSAQGVGPAARAAMDLPAGRTHLVMGPCIRGCCFSVKEDFIEAFRGYGHDVERWLESREGLWYFHLDRFLLEDSFGDLPPDRKHLEALRCTVCSSPQLPSYRRDRKTDPSIRAWIVKPSKS